MSSCAAMVVLAIAFVLAPGTAVRRAGAVPDGASPPSLRETLGRYFHDPGANYRAVIALGRAGTEGWPPPFLLLLADAHIRAGNLGFARRFLSESLVRNPEPQWATWAELGLGWIALVSGDLAAARAHYGHVASAEGGNAVAQVVLGLLAAAEGQGAAAAATSALRALAAGPGAGVNPKRIPASLLNLDARSLLRASLKRYRHVPLGHPEEQLVALLDADGAGLARAALERLGEAADEAAPGATAEEREDAAASPVEAASLAPAPQSATPHSSAHQAVEPDGASRRWPLLVLSAVVLLALAGRRLWGRRNPSLAEGA